MTRRHDIDALRVLAFGLLILYHTGILYVAPVFLWRGFPLHSSHMAEWLQYPMLFLNRWRMELLFLISGLAVNFLRRRNSLAKTAWQRCVRLLLPLVFGMLVVVPIQPYVEAVTKHAIEPGFGPYLLHYWTGGRAAGLTWAHLWYLPYLWVYTMILLALLPLLDSTAGQWLRAFSLRLRGTPLLLVPALPLFAYGMLLSAHFPETHALAEDWYAHAVYATMFFYGYLIGIDAALWTELARLRWRALTVALTCFVPYLFLDKFAGPLVGNRPIAPVIANSVMMLHVWLRYTYGWTAIVAILGWGHTLLNHPFRWLPYAREAVYPWYILHQSFLVFFAWLLLPLSLGPVVEPALILLGTISGCALLHEFVIRRTRWLRPMFGLAMGGPPQKATKPLLADDMA